MKHILLVVIIMGFISGNSYGQVLKTKNDTFYFDNEVPLDYNIYPKRNDSNSDSYDIISTSYIAGKAFSATIPNGDPSKIRIIDPDTSQYTGIFKYTLQNKLNAQVDTAWVVFFKSKLSKELRPADVNNDGIVNHLDLLPIGIRYNVFGSPRHIKDTSVSFIPKSAGNWNTATRNVNDKFIDINGDGLIDSNDAKLISTNFGKSWKAASPLNSAPSFSTFLTAKLSQDTLNYFNGKISLPVRIENQSLIQSYGIAFSYQLKYLNKQSGADSIYRNNTNVVNFNLWNEKPLQFFQTNGVVHYVSAVKTNGNNGPTDGYAGVVEIVVDDIVMGLIEVGNVGRMSIEFSDLLFVDNKHTPIDVSPKPYTFYVKKVSSSIQSAQKEFISVYPNLFENYFIIEKSSHTKESYEIYNAFGQLIDKGILNGEKSIIDNLSWAPGLYYLKLESFSTPVKLQKQ